MCHRQGRGNGEAVEQYRAFRLAAEVPHNGHNDDKGNVKEDGQTNNKGRSQNGPGGAIPAELVEKPIGQDAASAGVFDEPSYNRSERDNDRDKSEGISEPVLN